MKRKIAGYVSEHEHGLVHLTFMRDAISRLVHNGRNDDDIKIVDDAYSFLASDLMTHCAKEETELYPLFKDLMSQAVTRKLIDEHILINLSLIQFRNALAVLKSNNGDSKQIIKLKEESDSFIDLLHSHIKEENNLLQLLLRNYKTERKYNENKSLSI